MAHMHHHVDKGRKSRNSMDWCRCSGEGCFHLVREVSVGADMVDNRFRLEQKALTCRVDLRLLNKRYS